MPNAPVRRAALESLVAVTFRHIVTATRNRDRITGKAAGLPTAQLRLLAIARREPGICLSACAARLNLDVSTVSTLVRALGAARIVRTVTDPSDRRRKLLYPRPAAAKYRAPLNHVHAEPLRMLLRHLTATELRSLHRGLAAVAQRNSLRQTSSTRTTRASAFPRRMPASGGAVR